jgi:hypothetical protein
MVRLIPGSVAIVLMINACHADEFQPLLKGNDFEGWHAYARPLPDGTQPDPWSVWSIKDGVVTCTGKPVSFLATKKDYENYTLKVKWKYPADALTRVKRPNSGVLIHCNGPDKIWPYSLEIQLANGDAGDIWLQDDENKKFPTLDVVKERHDPKQPRRFVRMGGETRHFEKALGEWNQYEIKCQGGEVTVSVNGEKANHATDGSLKKGRIGFQAEGVEIQFKDIEIKMLSPDKSK